MTFSLPSNDATDDIIYMPSDLPFLENPSSREQAAERLQKLVSLEDFGVRWGFTSRTHGNRKGKEVEKYKSYGKDSENERHACAEQYAAFRDVFEDFIHPEAYWELDEDETWFGMCEDSIISWYESMIREISITLLDRNQSYSAALMHSDIP